MSQTRAALIRAAAEVLAAAGVPGPEREARLLMRWAAVLDGAALAAREGDAAPPEEQARFDAGLERRAGREPLSHITGTRAFWGREFQVTADVLDPRPETEVLVADALHRGPFGRVLDLGTGSGAILVSLLAEWPEARGTGTDLSPAALEVARGNAARHGVSDRTTWIEADWTRGLDGAFDLIVSNPPYLAEVEMAGISPEVRHEPRAALTPGGDGLDAYRAIARGARALLAPGGLLMVEIGPEQPEAVSALLAHAGWRVAAILPDLDQRARVIVARG